MENMEGNCKLSREKIGKIWKKGKLNSEMIWKIWKKIVKRYGKYERKLRNAEWYGKYGRKASRIVIRYGKYGRKLWNDMKNTEEK